MNQREQYCALLDAIKEEPVIDPSKSYLMEVCPHLTVNNIDQLLSFKKDGMNYFAVPGVRVEYGCNVLRLYNDRNKGRVVLSYACTGRTPASYSPSIRNGVIADEYQYMAEAIQYSLEHWMDELVIDHWREVLTFIMCDPSDLTDAGRPKKKSQIHAPIRTTLQDIRRNRQASQHMEVDNNIIEQLITVSSIEYREILGKRHRQTFSICMNCGGALGIDMCNVCRIKYARDEFGSNENMPIPPKIYAVAIDFVTFGRDPQTAWTRDDVSFERYKKSRVQKV